MSEIFYDKNQLNLFDEIEVNVDKIYSIYHINTKYDPQINRVNFLNKYYSKLYRNSLIPLKIRIKFWHLFRQTNLDLTWFNEFNNYWKKVIGGRPLWNLQDLFYLKNLFRTKFQKCQIPDTDDSKIHLEAWQRPELIYQLLHLVCKESVFNEYILLKLLRHYKKNFNSLLEYGCATAPIATSLFELFHLHKKIKIYISDIKTLAFNYAAYKFRNCSNVIPLLLVAENDFLLNLNEKIDVITCITVFEHLNKPLETIKIFYETLNPKGLLFFDYIKSSGDGLDTMKAVREREEVLHFISKKFQVIYGNINPKGNVGLTIVKKRN